jgi:hypothetical protein
MPTPVTFGKPLTRMSKTGRSHGVASIQTASPHRGNHCRAWSHQRWRQDHGLPFRRDSQLCPARLIACLATACSDSLRPCRGELGSKAARFPAMYPATIFHTSDYHSISRNETPTQSSSDSSLQDRPPVRSTPDSVVASYTASTQSRARPRSHWVTTGMTSWKPCS